MAAKKSSGRKSKTAPKKTIKKQRIASKKGAAKKAAKAKKPAGAAAGSQKRTEFLKKLLLKKRNEIVEGIEAQLGRKLSSTPGQKIDSAMDAADLSSLDMDEGVSNSLLEMKYDQYKDIADAFRKLQNGTYGLCEECGADIDIKRMEVNPFARYCVGCKARIEEFEKIQKEPHRFKGE